jgi:peptidoglycan/LPS O-acetylase OafA/YrhL
MHSQTGIFRSPAARSLEGIRGLCSIIIVLGHLFTFWIATPPDYIFPVFAVEYLSAVTMFFVISGYTLVHVYNDPREKSSKLTTNQARKQFYWKRVARLAPVYYLGLLLAIVPFAVYTADTMKIAINIPIALLAVQSIIYTGGSSWNGPLWTVGALAVCYAIFPWLLGKLRDKTVRQLITIGALCSLASIILPPVWLIIPGLRIHGFLLHSFVGFRIPHFIIGVCAGLICQRNVRPTVWWTELCTLLMLINFILCATLTVGNPELYIAYMVVIEFSIPAIQAVWIMGLAGNNTRLLGSIRLLQSGPLQLLGRYSYSLYCLHWPILNWCAWLMAGRGITREAVPLVDPKASLWLYHDNGWIALPLLFVCTIIAAFAYHFVEKPSRATIQRWASQKCQK